MEITIEVGAINTDPIILPTALNDLTINESNATTYSDTGELAFNIGDIETAITDLTIQASSGNTAVVPNTFCYESGCSGIEDEPGIKITAPNGTSNQVRNIRIVPNFEMIYSK